MFGSGFVSSGLGALAFALLISLIAIFVIFAVLGWLARRRGL
jgi:hypothetical protein